MIGNNEKIATFKKELELIKDSNLRTFVENTLAGTGEWFYKDPASTSGRYHPTFALGVGGLVRHTKAVVYWVKELCKTKMFDVDERQEELLVAAAILHDIRKHGNDGSYISNHATESQRMILESQKAYGGLLGEQDAQFIAEAVATHMGIWGERDGARKPESDAEKLLHLADYCASRKEIELKFDEDMSIEEKRAINEERKEPTNEIGPNTKMGFGKYADKTIEEVYVLDSQYLYWIAGNDNFFDDTFRKCIQVFLKEKIKPAEIAVIG